MGVLTNTIQDYILVKKWGFFNNNTGTMYKYSLLVIFALVAYSEAKCSLKQCRMLCPNGFEVDKDGCQICECKEIAPMVNDEPKCSLIQCRMRCPFGFVVDENGCEKCECNKCPLKQCRMLCPNGFEVDANGCQICQCRETAPMKF